MNTWEEAAAHAALLVPEGATRVREDVNGEWLHYVRESFDALRANPEAEDDWFALACLAFGGYLDFAAATGLPDNPFLARDDLVHTLAQKQFDYGHENVTAFGIDGLLVRAHDKIARLRNLLNRETPSFESVEDTWLDLTGYSILAMMVLNGTFGLSLALDQEQIALDGDDEADCPKCGGGPCLFASLDEALADAEASLVNNLMAALEDGTIELYILDAVGRQ